MGRTNFLFYFVFLIRVWEKHLFTYTMEQQFSGVFLLMIIIPSVATERASADFVFTHFNTDNGEGISSRLYIFLIGLLMSQYTLTGYDASAHMVNLLMFFLTFYRITISVIAVKTIHFLIPLD